MTSFGPGTPPFVDRTRWPDWARLANAAGRSLAEAERLRPAGVTRSHRELALSLQSVPQWLLCELAAEHGRRMAIERWAEAKHR